MGLPDLFSRWFESRGWAPRPHQLALVDLARQGRSALLIAPTGGGKTLAGFLPSLIELTERRQSGQDLAYKKGQGELHTLYISPLKALADTPADRAFLGVLVRQMVRRDGPHGKRRRSGLQVFGQIGVSGRRGGRGRESPLSLPPPARPCGRGR